MPGSFPVLPVAGVLAIVLAVGSVAGAYLLLKRAPSAGYDGVLDYSDTAWLEGEAFPYPILSIEDGIPIHEALSWPVPVTNVEGSAVARVASELVFLYAERAHGSNVTHTAGATLSLNLLAFGSFDSVVFHCPDPDGPGARPVPAFEVGSRGRLYVVSAFDLEHDGGPFRSVIWEASRVVSDSAGIPRVGLLPAFRGLRPWTA